MSSVTCAGVASVVRGCTRTRVQPVAARLRVQYTPVRQPILHIRVQQRQASTSRPNRNANASASSSASTSPEDDNKKKKPLQNPRNEAIPFTLVRLVNPQTGALDPPARLRDILPTVDRKRQYLELVAETPEPIVKMINVKERYDRSRAKHVQQVLGRAPEETELQLTWGVAAGDLAFKLRKAREDLMDGDRVTLVFAPKKGQPAASSEDRAKIVEEAIRLLADVGRERKECVVQGNVVALYLEPLRPKQVHDLKWAYTGDEPWSGVNAVVKTLRSGGRVDVVFSLPPPPKATKNDLTLAEKVVDPSVVKEGLERTVKQLAEVGREWKPRETKKTSVVLHLEGLPAT